MPPNMQRFLPLVLIGALLIFVLPALLKKHSTGPSTKTKAADTQQTMNLVDKSEQQYLTAHSRYSSHVADLIALAPALAGDLGGGVTVALDVSSDGATYFAQVVSDSLSLTRARDKTNVIAQSCLALKSGANCPAAK